MLLYLENEYLILLTPPEHTKTQPVSDVNPKYLCVWGYELIAIWKATICLNSFNL